jgi:hypothetical protein
MPPPPVIRGWRGQDTPESRQNASDGHLTGDGFIHVVFGFNVSFAIRTPRESDQAALPNV